MTQLKKLTSLILIVIMFLTPALLKAQPALEDENVLDSPVPFDGGVSSLLVATVVYGLRKARSMKSSKDDTMIF